MDGIPIILDKSYLQGIPAGRFQELSEQYQWLMPDILFYELISSDEPGRSGCFKKFPQKPNPIPLVKHVGALLEKEQTTHKPAGLPSENPDELNCLTWRFNPALSNGSSHLLNIDKATMRKRKAELDRDISSLIKNSNLAPTIFPDINEQFIADSVDKLSGSLSSFELPDGATMPARENLNESWTLFRWFQVQLLFSLDILYRYNDINPSALTDKSREKLEHDVLDMHYLILGVLQSAFATKDKKLIRFYKLLCPNGLLIEGW